MAKTIEHVAEVLKQIKSEVNEDVIKEYTDTVQYGDWPGHWVFGRHHAEY